MVGRGELDENLEDETAEECSKYGPVVRCIAYEHPNDDDNANNDNDSMAAVRIFVEFAETTSARNALCALNGRFFAGRKVEATFYHEDAFLDGEYSLA